MKAFFSICLVLLSLTCVSQSLRVASLSCENEDSPVGIETTSPSLSWKLVSSKRNVLQTAYHVLISDDPALLKKNVGNVWDSKHVLSEQSLHIACRGAFLLPAKTYYWKVRVWDNQNDSSHWSKTVSMQMGLLTDADWKGAKWIGFEHMPDSMYIVPGDHQKGRPTWQGVKDVLPIVRTTILIPKPFKKITAFACGLGHFELSANGKKIGDHFLDPGWTKYDKEAQYVVFDLTGNLHTGTNAIGVMLGNGFYFIPGERYRKLSGAYGYPKLRMRLVVEYNDGSIEDHLSNEQWKTSAGPITFSSIYGGEDYNATLEQKGWNTTGFNDAGWRNAVLVKGVPHLYHQVQPPLKVHETFTPKQHTQIRDGVHVFDLGQNASGIPQIEVRGNTGDTIRIIPGELLKDDGTVSQKGTGGPVYFQYILKGGGKETWQPRFSYYGFRYLQVEGCNYRRKSNTAKPSLVSIKGLHTRSSAPIVGSFASSSPLFNQIFDLINWSVKSNMASVLTDCPHREKLGWLEQAHLMGNSIYYNYDVANYFRKTIRDMTAAQGDSLHVPEYVPEFVKMPFMEGIFTDSPEWGSTAIILPWYLYEWYGDRTSVEENYELMQRYQKHLQAKSNNNILAYGLSDWYDLGPNRPGLAQLTPMGLTGTAVYYYDLHILQKAAKLLGKTKDEDKYRSLAAEVKRSFNEKFFKKDSLYYGSNSQTANAMALYFGLVPETYKNGVMNNLVTDIRQHQNSVTSGDIGFRYLLQTLQREGRSDIIYDMNSRSDVPGYGYQIAKGATALTESWQALPVVSNNHLMLGHLMEWLYSGLGGISQTSSSVGYKEIEINPQPVGDISSVKTSYESPYGSVKVSWSRSEADFTIDVSIPANTTAVICLPAENRTSITEDGKPLPVAVRTEQQQGRTKLNIGSGNYHFKVNLQEKEAGTK